MRLDTFGLGTSPDGVARLVVRVRFLDAGGRETRIIHAGDIEFSSSRGEVQWQTRTRFGGPAAVVSTTQSGPLSVRAKSLDPIGIADATVATDTRAWRAVPVVAQALGPHLVQVGWFPIAMARVKVTRAGPDGLRTICNLNPPSSTCRDTSARPSTLYKYTVAGVRDSAPLDVAVPPEIPSQPVAAVRGKGMWLRFSPDPLDEDAYEKLDPSEIVRRARSAGIRYIQIRMAYGPFWEITPMAKPRVDALIDAATAAGISVVAWTVPRTTNFDDLALAVAAAGYHTARGTAVAGLAVDLERGDGYLGSGPAASAAMASYAWRLRDALGPSYLIVATVEDPYLGSLTNRDVPYAAISRSANVLQPMLYWRMYEKAVDSVETEDAVRRSMLALRHEVGNTIPINVGGQTVGIGPCGAPRADELIASMRESQKLGAVGETFFDWLGTSNDQWDALRSFRWR